MSYTSVAPVDENSVHPTSPGVRVPYLPPGSTLWIWVIGTSQIVTTPVTQSELLVINARLDALVASVENSAAGTVVRYYSAVSIKNAETLGINSFATPVEGNAFYAVWRDVNGSAIRTQLWMFVGEESGFLDWQMITDTDGVVNEETTTDIAQLKTTVATLQTSIDSVATNVVVKFQTNIVAPNESTIPATVAVLDPSVYGDDYVVQVMFSNASAYYVSDGSAWLRTMIRYYGSNPIKKSYFSATTGIDYHESFFLKPGMDIKTDISYTTEGPANFYFIGTSTAVPHDPEIAHFYVGNNLYGQIVWWLDELTGGREYAKCATGATLLQKQTLPPDAGGGWIFGEIDAL